MIGVPPKERPRQFNLAAAHEAVDAGDLTLPKFKVNAPQEVPVSQALGLENHRVAGVAGKSRCFTHMHAGRATADHVSDDLVLVEVGAPLGRHALAVAENRDAIGDVEDIFEKMGNENDAFALNLEAAQSAKEPLHFRRRQCRGRFIENDRLGTRKEHPRQFYKLLHTNWQASHAHVRIKIEPEACDKFARLAIHACPVDDSASLDWLCTEKDIFCDREFGDD